MLQAIDVIASARREGQTDPYILLARLAECGLPDDRARTILRSEGFEIDDLVDPRFAEICPSRTRHGCVR